MKALAITALIGAAIAATNCTVPELGDPTSCTAATGLAFMDQPVSVRDHLNLITWRESRNQPTATNASGHVGCFQIATRVHAARIKRFGYTMADMLRAWPNAVIARSLFLESGFAPWVTA